jgi:hypothetical protein
VYLWWAKENRIEPVMIPIEEGVITREHLDTQQERDSRIEAFVEKLDSETFEVSITFRANLEALMRSEGVGDKVMTKIRSIE